MMPAVIKEIFGSERAKAHKDAWQHRARNKTFPGFSVGNAIRKFHQAVQASQTSSDFPG